VIALDGVGHQPPPADGWRRLVARLDGASRRRPEDAGAKVAAAEDALATLTAAARARLEAALGDGGAAALQAALDAAP